MAYDQHSYQPPRRQAAPQPTRQQYQQESAYNDRPQRQQQQQQQQYSQRGMQPQPSYAASADYGTFDPYAQDAGKPYGDSGGGVGGHMSNTHGYGSMHSHAYSADTAPAVGQQQDNRNYGQPSGYIKQASHSYGNAGRQQDPVRTQQDGRGNGYSQHDRQFPQQNGGYSPGNNEAYGRSNYVRDNTQGYGQNDYAQANGQSYGDQDYPQVNGYGHDGRAQANNQGYGHNGYGQTDRAQANNKGYGHNDRAQGVNQGYGRNDRAQGVNQGYEQIDRARNGAQGYAQNGGQGHVQQDNYSQSSRRPRTAESQANGMINGQTQQPQEERRYDARYQQRPGQSQPLKSPTPSTFGGQPDRYAPDQRPATMTPVRSNANLQSSQSAPSFSAFKKLTMDEWKAQEKAKMHKDASKPETLAQDNAFPTFPTKKTESTRGGGQTAMSTRSSEEPPRPSTASSRRAGDRPPLSRNENSQPDVTDSARPSLDYKPHTFESARPSMDNQHRPERMGSPLHRTEILPQQAVRPARTDSYNNATQPSPGRSTRTVAPRIDTDTTQEMPPALDRVSPSHTRLSTSDSDRYARKPVEQPMSPLGKFAQSAQDQTLARQPPSQPAYQHHPQPSILSEVYDGYYEKRDTVASKSSLTQQPMTRDEEIEAEMPDFDSAAPSQTSQLHKRNQTIDQHLSNPTTEAPPVPTLPAKIGGHGGNPAGNFDFGFSQQQDYGQRQYQADQALARPVQPYASEPNVRRSMDDARQGQQSLPVGRPPPQRYYGDNAPRPDFDRQGTTFSDPGMQRVGSVPPARPGTQQSFQPASDLSVRSDSTPVNPDVLPAHPPPVRPGLIAGAAPAASRPAPVRNYGSAAAPPTSATPAPRAVSGDAAAKTPITQAELQQLRAQVEANPQSMKTALLYAKKLVEASKVLATEGGRADAKTAAKNRERYIMDAYKRVKKLVSAGYPDAQFYLADCYGQGMLGLEVDSKEAFKLYQAAAKAGHSTAAYRTAVCCEIGADEGGGTSRDFPRAVQWYRRAAALGETAAMFKVGMIALKGLLGQPRNLGEATTWLKRAAERADKDNPHALHELAVLYETANSTPELRHKVIPDDAYALSLYKQAAGFGAKNSQFRLGQAYEYGQLGLPIDHRASIAWYSKAAAQGEHQAELALSGWYLTGAPGILEHSDTEAYLWARKAAQAEPPLAKAMFAMGYFLETGIGCATNIEEAKRWYGRAATYKHPKALERLEAIKRGAKGGYKAMPATKKISRKDQKHDEAECVVM